MGRVLGGLAAFLELFRNLSQNLARSRLDLGKLLLRILLDVLSITSGNPTT
jgi:hypothetical protein